VFDRYLEPLAASEIAAQIADADVFADDQGTEADLI
jgi:hypothetical protein